MSERNYHNYSEEHHAAAAAIADGAVTCSYDTALWMTQSTLPGALYIPDPVELLYPHRVQPLNVEESYPRTYCQYNPAKPKTAAESRRETRIVKDSVFTPSFIWDISGGQYPRGKAFRKLIKREMQAQQIREGFDHDLATPYFGPPPGVVEETRAWLEKNMRLQGALNGHN